MLRHNAHILVSLSGNIALGIGVFDVLHIISTFRLRMQRQTVDYVSGKLLSLVGGRCLQYTKNEDTGH